MENQAVSRYRAPFSRTEQRSALLHRIRSAIRGDRPLENGERTLRVPAVQRTQIGSSAQAAKHCSFCVVEYLTARQPAALLPTLRFLLHVDSRGAGIRLQPNREGGRPQPEDSPQENSAQWKMCFSSAEQPRKSSKRGQTQAATAGSAAVSGAEALPETGSHP
ncbi:UNVERIFIED_CONTAM: hypothetical protein HHA_451080 [Hammondia hammondi]|eukprot:XP_008883642.1 hypothetical protein HHA_451080 [Hammondia hammondi]